MNAEYARPSCLGWQYAPLGAVGIVTLGKMLSPSPKSPSDSTRPYLRAAHIQPQGRLDFDVTEKTMWFSEAEVNSLDLQEGDIVIVEGGAGYGRSALINKPLDGWGFQNSIVRVRPNIRKGHSPYIRYALQLGYDSKMIELECFTATLPHFTAEKVSRFRIPLPDLPTQRRVADYLDRETAQIDAMAEALDGLVARLEERRENLRDIEYRRASMSHKTPRIRVICESIIDGPFGSSLTSAHYTESGVRVIRLGNIGVNKFKDSDKAFISETHGNTLSNHDALPGDVIIAGLGDLNNPVGRACVVPEDVGRSIVKADCYRVRPGKTVNPSFLAHMLNAPQVREVSRRSSRGSTRIRLTTGIAANSRIPLPPLDEQRRIADHLDAETAKIDAMIAKAGELRALLDERRSALITATVTGQHPVPEEH